MHYLPASWSIKIGPVIQKLQAFKVLHSKTSKNPSFDLAIYNFSSGAPRTGPLDPPLLRSKFTGGMGGSW